MQKVIRDFEKSVFEYQVADLIVSLISGQIDKVTAMLMMRQRREDVERILAVA